MISNDLYLMQQHDQTVAEEMNPNDDDNQMTSFLKDMGKKVTLDDPSLPMKLFPLHPIDCEIKLWI